MSLILVGMGYWREEVTVELESGTWIEVKLKIKKGNEAQFLCPATGGKLDFDLHGEVGSEVVSYENRQYADGDEGAFTAQFDGEHGWYWLNQQDETVSVTLFVRGDFESIVQYQ